MRFLCVLAIICITGIHANPVTTPESPYAECAKELNIDLAKLDALMRKSNELNEDSYRLMGCGFDKTFEKGGKKMTIYEYYMESLKTARRLYTDRKDNTFQDIENKLKGCKHTEHNTSEFLKCIKISEGPFKDLYRYYG